LPLAIKEKYQQMKPSERPDFTKSSSEVAAEIAQFAQLHQLHVHPSKTPESWAQQVVRIKGCPCVPERLLCPCDEALQDIERAGVCRCLLFCTADRYAIFAEKEVNEGA